MDAPYQLPELPPAERTAAANISLCWGYLAGKAMESGTPATLESLHAAAAEILDHHGITSAIRRAAIIGIIEGHPRVRFYFPDLYPPAAPPGHPA
jgi:hypothetical protein